MRLRFLLVLLAACRGTPSEPTRPPTIPEPSSSGSVVEPPRPCGGKDLRVKFYDVGQGLSALVELPDDRRILVDTGEQPIRAGCADACRLWSNHLLSAL